MISSRWLWLCLDLFAKLGNVQAHRQGIVTQAKMWFYALPPRVRQVPLSLDPSSKAGLFTNSGTRELTLKCKL